MEKELNNYLKENERVCWQGKPMKFPLLEKGTKFSILSKWILIPIVAIALLVAYFSNNDVRSMGFIGLVTLVSVLAMVSPIIEWRNVLGQQYWITNQRVIVQTRDKSFFYMSVGESDDFQIVHDVADQDCVVLGSSIFAEAHKQMRWRSCHPLTNTESQAGHDHAEGMVLYGIGNADTAEDLLKRYAKAVAA